MLTDFNSHPVFAVYLMIRKKGESTADFGGRQTIVWLELRVKVPQEVEFSLLFLKILRLSLRKSHTCLRHGGM